jgi:glucose-1-phosphate cytidylyltransferase
MKVVILAGGLGTRLAEETDIKPKPMVEVGDQPILWHILKHYSHFGMNEFYVALGYKGEAIKRYFHDYYEFSGSMTVDFTKEGVMAHEHTREDWLIHLIDTGRDTMTGGRVKRLQKHLYDGPFLLTYGDGVCDVDIYKLIRFHKEQRKLVTITAVRPPARFGGLIFDGTSVTGFTEKPVLGEDWINGGFMVVEPEVFDYLENDQSVFEVDGLQRLAADGQLAAYKHSGFWQCMDTLREKRYLNDLWASGKAPWKVY